MDKSGYETTPKVGSPLPRLGYIGVRTGTISQKEQHMKAAPKPRNANFYGMRSEAQINEDGTWLEPEEITYPSGGFLRRAYVFVRKNEHNPVKLPYGELRVVTCSISDTFISIPARLKYQGKTVKGFISGGGDKPMTFTPEADPAHCPCCAPGEGCR